MSIDEVIKLLEEVQNDNSVNITKVNYYEGTTYYKNKKENGEIVITIRYEEKGEKNEKD